MREKGSAKTVISRGSNPLRDHFVISRPSGPLLNGKNTTCAALALMFWKPGPFASSPTGIRYSRARGIIYGFSFVEGERFPWLAVALCEGSSWDKPP
jgi:hypothetical protein